MITFTLFRFLLFILSIYAAGYAMAICKYFGDMSNKEERA